MGEGLGSDSWGRRRPDPGTAEVRCERLACVVADLTGTANALVLFLNLALQFGVYDAFVGPAEWWAPIGSASVQCGGGGCVRGFHRFYGLQR